MKQPDTSPEKHALILWGGWLGHQPEEVAHIFANALQRHNFSVTLSPTLAALLDAREMERASLIIPIYTMSAITPPQLAALLGAVQRGVGLGGCHGGMCDAFRQETEYQFMTGGQWVAHPGGATVTYSVQITNHDHFITAGSHDFNVTSEQYYLHVDPANNVLATTRFPTVDGPHVPNGPVAMPVIWTKYYGRGRVFYCSIGHQAHNVRQPEVLRLCERGLLWAAHAEDRV
jgi:type 1 glutamine amidotransferase